MENEINEMLLGLIDRINDRDKRGTATAEELDILLRAAAMIKDTKY